MSSAHPLVYAIFVRAVLVSLFVGWACGHTRAAPIRTNEPADSLDTPEMAAKRKSKELLAKAEESKQKKELRLAVRYYGEYLRIMPEDREVQVTQALTAAAVLDQKDIRATDVFLADRLLQAALRQDDLRDRRDLRRRLIDVQVLRHQFQEAMQNIDLLNSKADKPDPELDFLYARCAYASNRLEIAESRLETLTGYDSASRTFDAKRAAAAENIDAYMLLALLLRENKKLPVEADNAIDAMVAANPKSARALVQRSAFKIRYSENSDARMTSAKDDLRKALELDPKNVEALMQNAVLDSMDKNYASAAKRLNAALEIAPDDERLYLRLAGVLFLLDKRKEAIAKIEEAMARLPQSQELPWALHEFQLRNEDIPAAKKTIERMEELRIPPERILLAKARIPLVERKWDEAARQLEKIRPRLNVYVNLALSADLALGQCYANLNQPDRQLEVYNRILTTDSHNVEALRGKAAALTTLKRHQEALEVYQKQLAPTLGAAAFRADRGLMDAYRAVLKALADQDPGAREEFERLARNVAKGGMNKVSDDPVENVIFRADELLRQKKYSEASEVLKTEIASHPKDLRLRLALVAVVAAQRDPDAALTSLNEVERDLGSSAQTIGLRGELLVRRGGPDVKQQLTKLEGGLEKYSVQDRANIWKRLGALYHRLGVVGQADCLRSWNEALKLEPKNAALLEGVFGLARAADDQQAMLAAEQKISDALGQESTLWKYAEAARLLSRVRQLGIPTEEASLNQAQQLVAEALSQRRDWYQLHRLQAEVKVLTNQPDEAIRCYQNAMELGPTDPATVQKLVELQIARGRYADARTSLRKLGDGVAVLGRLRFLPEVLGGGDPATVVKDLEREIPDSSTKPLDLLWKGQLLLRLHEQDKAEKALRRAVELGPDQSQTWLALVEFLARYRNKADAERVVRDAENKLSDDAAPLVLAQCYALLQDNDRAEKHYLTALNKGPKTPLLVRNMASFYLQTRQSAKAAQLLNMLIEAGPRLRGDDLEHVTWARRELALLLAQNPSYADFQKAVRLVEADSTGGTAASSNAPLVGRLYASRRDARSLRQAEQMLENLKNTPDFGFEEKLALATVYINTDRFEKGRLLLAEVSAERPDELRALTMMAEALLQRKDIGEAETWVRKLERAQPKSPQTVRLQAMLAMNRDRAAEAEAIVVGSLPKEITENNLAEFVRGARMLEDVKNYAAAEKLLRDSSAHMPAAKWDLAEFLARRGKIEECLALVKELVTDKTLETACQVGTMALREGSAASGSVKPAHGDLVRSWLDQATKRPPASATLLINQALFLDVMGDPKKAELTYREILKFPGLTEFYRATVANNLAYLLALNGGDLAEARKLTDSSMTEMGPVPELLDTLAMIEMAKGNNAEAIKLLSEATHVTCTPEIYFHLALAHQKGGNREAATRWNRRAIEAGLRRGSLPEIERRRLDELTLWLKS